MIRNCISISLALDATNEEIDAAHAIIDRAFGSGGAKVERSNVTVVRGGDSDGNDDDATGGDGDGIGTDSEGLPWDERIHSSNKKKTDAGKWVARRNVDAAVRTKVVAELHAANAANTSAAAGATPPKVGGPKLPGAGGPKLPGAGSVDPNYTALVKVAAEHTENGNLPEGFVGQTIAYFAPGVDNLQGIAGQPEIVKQVLEYLNEQLGL